MDALLQQIFLWKKEGRFTYCIRELEKCKYRKINPFDYIRDKDGNKFKKKMFSFKYSPPKYSKISCAKVEIIRGFIKNPNHLIFKNTTRGFDHEPTIMEEHMLLCDVVNSIYSTEVFNPDLTSIFCKYKSRDNKNDNKEEDYAAMIKYQCILQNIYLFKSKESDGFWKMFAIMPIESKIL
jgi:hypothetical protein